jgi:glycosyltransferase involved in cell wall biosynthesis
MPAPLLSVVVITWNEEEDLPGFLASFLPIADEIVIIDDGSTDRTGEIAAGAGDKVRFIAAPRAAGEGFCDQRQKGVEAARGQWLLQVDCDMRLGDGLAEEIGRAVRRSEYDAFRFRLEQYWMNRPIRHGGFQYWNAPWLVRRSAVRGWIQQVHERIAFKRELPLIGQLERRMVHLNDRDFDERLRKNRQYSALEVERLLAEGETFPAWKMFTIPFARFLRSYLLMRGFLDGGLGFAWAIYQFSGTATVYLMGWSRRHGGVRAERPAATARGDRCRT